MDAHYKTLNKLSFLDKGIRTWKISTLIILFSFLIYGIVLFALYQDVVVRTVDRVYIAKDYSIERVLDKKAMVVGHVKNFYKLFFGIDANNYKKNVSEALELIGESGKELMRAYANNKYYDRVVANNLWIDVEIDSVVVLNNEAPYQVNVFARRFIRSAYGVKQAYTNSKMIVNLYSNSEKNPFGLIIENFEIVNDNEVPEVKKQ